MNLVGTGQICIVTKLGYVRVSASHRGVEEVAFLDDPPKHHLESAAEIQDFPEWTAEVERHIENPKLPIAVPLDIQGTLFQRRVWEALRRIPTGETRTYAQLAATLGCPTSVRAVAGACAANRLAVLIPCHRVVRSDGGLGGYRWGIERKQELLRREAAALSPLFGD